MYLFRHVKVPGCTCNLNGMTTTKNIVITAEVHVIVVACFLQCMGFVQVLL